MPRAHLSLASVIAGLLAIGNASSAVAQGTTPAPKNLDIKAPDGVVLKATYYDAGRPGPGLIFLHACNMDRASWSGLATAAAGRGFHVLALDFRGFGESGGTRFAPGADQQQIIDTTWPADVEAALATLTAQAGVDKSRIGAAGASCGVNQSVQLARKHPEVKSIVMLSGTVNENGRRFLRDSPNLPLLAAASHGDGGAVNQMQWLLGWSRYPANKFVEYKAAGHGTEMFAAEKGLMPTVLEWFDANVRKAAPKAPTAASTTPTPAETFWTTLTSPDGVAKARAMYDDAKKAGKRSVLFPETETNLYGYQLLQGGNTKDAIEVFKLNVDAYPNSANTYDSLSDAYLAADKRAEALKYAEQAIAMLPKDLEAGENFKTLVRESAEKKIKELRKN